MRHTILLTAALAACLSGGVEAHFVLVQPANLIVQNRLRDPQKIAPCGGISANAARGTAANPGVPSGAITEIKGGTNFHVLVQETVFHPGHYRVALARVAADDGVLS